MYYFFSCSSGLHVCPAYASMYRPLLPFHEIQGACCFFLNSEYQTERTPHTLSLPLTTIDSRFHFIGSHVNRTKIKIDGRLLTSRLRSLGDKATYVTSCAV